MNHMRQRIFFFLLFVVSCPLSANPILDLPAVRVQAKSFILLDNMTNQVLASSNPDQRMPPASLTKVMTLYIAADLLMKGSLSLDDQVRVSAKAWKTGGSRMFIEEGKQVSVGNLIEGIAVVSGNDASIALSEHIAGSEEKFVHLMNKKAAELGMKNTRFSNATGLPDVDLYTTAYDLSILSRSLINRFPHFYKKYFSQRRFSYNNINQLNRNKLLWTKSLDVDGIKTGHTNEAGFNLASSAVHGDMRLIVVVLGAPKESVRLRDSEKLLRWGFRYFRHYHLYDVLTPLTTARVWMGAQDMINLGVAHPVDIVISKEKTQRVNVHVQIQEFLQAPISIGQRVGELVVYTGQDEHSRYPLITLETVAEGGIFSRFFDWVLLNAHQLLS